MATRPTVKVIQKVLNPSFTPDDAELNVAIVGPAYNVQDYVEGTDDLFVDAYGSKTAHCDATDGTPTGIPTAGTPAVTVNEAPNHVAGSILDESSVKLYLSDALTLVASGIDGVIAADTNDLSSASATFTTNVNAGDRVLITAQGDVNGTTGSVTIERKVLSVVSDTALKLTSNVTAAGTDVLGREYTALDLVSSALYRVERAEVGVSAPDSAVTPTNGVVELDGGLSIGGRLVTFANVHMQYRELRQDLADLKRVDSVAAAQSLLGDVDERNPLSAATNVALQNTSTYVYVYGVKNDNLNGNTDRAQGYTEARDLLEGTEVIYAIVPLTSDTSILTMYKNHAEAMSDPAKSKFRVVIGSGELATTKVVSPDSTATVTDGSPGYDLVDNSATFLSDGVVVGDLVVVDGVSQVIVSVLSENNIKVDNAGDGYADTTINYRIERSLDKPGQVTALSDVTNGLNSKRVVMVWPDVCTVAGLQNKLTGLQNDHPGYYLAAAVGGMVAGNPSHQNFTGLSVAGVTGLKHSSGYFSDDQIDELSDAGWYVMLQRSANAAPYCVHALTTASGPMEDEEFMVVKNFDYVAVYYRNILREFLRGYNVLPETLDLIVTAFNSGTRVLQSKRYTKLGAPVLDATVRSIASIVGAADQVELVADISLPRPLNGLTLYLNA